MTQKENLIKTIKCFICAGDFPADEVIELKGRHACADCKGELVQLISEGVNLADRTVARDGNVLVMGRKAQLPKRCVKCNRDPADYPLQRHLSYHSPVVYLTLLIGGPLLYLLVAVVTQRKAKVTVPICAHHRVSRTHHFFWAWGGVAFALLTFYAGMRSGEEWLFAAAVIPFCVFLGFAIYLSRVVVPVGIDKEYVRLKGVNSEYLEELPDWKTVRD